MNDYSDNFTELTEYAFFRWKPPSVYTGNMARMSRAGHISVLTSTLLSHPANVRTAQEQEVSAEHSQRDTPALPCRARESTDRPFGHNLAARWRRGRTLPNRNP